MGLAPLGGVGRGSMGVTSSQQKPYTRESTFYLMSLPSMTLLSTAKFSFKVVLLKRVKEKNQFQHFYGVYTFSPCLCEFYVVCFSTVFNIRSVLCTDACKFCLVHPEIVHHTAWSSTGVESGSMCGGRRDQLLDPTTICFTLGNLIAYV